MNLKDFIIRTHHIGYAVQNHHESEESFQSLGYSLVQEKILDEYRNIYISFFQNNNTLIEIISIADINKKSPLDSILVTSKNALPYHVCYETNNLDAAIGHLKEQKFMLIVPPAKAIALSNNQVAFLYHKHMGIIELVEM